MLGAVGCLLPAIRVPNVASAGEADTAWSEPIQSDRFGDFDDDAPYPGPDELRAMLGQVPGERYEISEMKRRNRRSVGYVSGLFRVNLPWPEEGGLRVSYWDPERLRLHLWAGQTGVTLAYYPRFHQVWAAYANLMH